MKIRSLYDPYTAEDAARFGYTTVGDSLTRQSEAEDCDINNIVKKYQSTGLLPDMIKENPQYGDFSSVADFQQSMDIIAFANAQFNALDAHVRDRFANDPAKFLAFCEKTENAEELIKMGLATRRPDPVTPDSTTLKDVVDELKRANKPKAARKPYNEGDDEA